MATGPEYSSMKRRQYLRGGLGIATAATLAGCMGLFETRPARTGPVLENRPDAVYYPTHYDGMTMAGMGMAGPYKVALSYTFPHRFWTITGDRTTQVDVTRDDTIHLMATVWDDATGMVVPTANNSVEISANGDLIDERSLWPMLSERMGFHFGDNVTLDGDGTYATSLQISPPDAELTGDFAGRFDEPITADLEFEYSKQELEGLGYTPLPDKQGTKGAVPPMEMDMMPIAATPSADDFPGTVIDTATSGDATFVAASVEADRFGDGPYLAISPRTPYNGFPMPLMGLGATLERDGEAIFDDSLTATLDPELGYHYGAVVDGIESGDTVTLRVETPPQVSRHQGYETAFLQFSEMTMTV